MDKRKKKAILCGLGFIIGVILVVAIYRVYESKQLITYDQLIGYVKTEQVARIETIQDDPKITVILKDGTQNKVIVPSMEEFSAIISEELQKDTSIEIEAKKGWKLDASIIMLGVTTGFLWSMYKGTIGDSGKQNEMVQSKVTFREVAGLTEERAQFEEIVQFLKDSKKYESIGAKVPKGILLYGEPGTGKTLLAKAIAGEAGVPFFQMSGSAFEEKFVGVGASRVRKLFDKAKSVAPSIIFIDEIDAVGRSRYDGGTYSEQTLNQLLAEMDGFDSSSNVIVIAATNCKEVLDPALLRPGRFNRHIFVPKPDVRAREEILKIHAQNKRISDTVSLEEIAQKTVGFSGADLENILNEAAIFAVSQGKECIDNNDITEAITRVLVGLEKKNAAITQEDKKLTAIHEAGHAIVSAIQRPDVKNFGISIVQRGIAGGYNYFDEPDAKYSRKEELKKQISVLYGGRAAEEVILGDISSGASNDLERATQIAYLMVNKFAMDGNLMVQLPKQTEYNDAMAKDSVEKAESICKDAYIVAKQVVMAYRPIIEKLANLLFEKESLSQEEIEAFLKENLK